MIKQIDMSDALKQVREDKEPEDGIELKDGKLPVSDADKRLNTLAYQNYKSGDKEHYTAADDLEEQKRQLEEQLKQAQEQLDEIYMKEDKAWVIRFKRIKDKERMVVVFKNQHDADMYADNIKKQGGQVFSNKLEKIPYKVVDKK